MLAATMKPASAPGVTSALAVLAALTALGCAHGYQSASELDIYLDRILTARSLEDMGLGP